MEATTELTNIETIPAANRRRDITKADADSIAKASAKGLSEKAVCLRMGFEPTVWYRWKAENRDYYNTVFEIARENRVESLMAEVETASQGGNDACGRPIRHDWRAADRLLAITDPSRFSQRVSEAPVSQTVSVTILAELSRLVFGEQPAIDISASGDAIAALADAGPGEVINAPSDNVVTPAAIVVSESPANAVIRKPRRKQGDRTMRTYLQG